MSNTRRVAVAVAVLAVVAGAVLWQRPGPLDAPRSEPSPRGSATPTPDPSPETPTAAPCPDTTQTISVLTFNMHSGWHAGRLDLKATARAIRASKADIVLIQEVDRFRINSNAVDQAAWLGRELDLDWAYGANDVRARARPGLPRGAIGNAILSRFPLSQVDNTLLPAPVGLQNRGLLRAVADVNGVRLGVYATHLDHTSPTVRIAQAQRIRAALREERLPVLLGGDLNAEPGMPAVNVVLAGRLRDTWAAVGTGVGRTVPAGDPRRRVDYILHSPEITPLAADVLLSGHSDHREVVARLVLPVPSC